MNEPPNKMLIEKWKNADALYATPTGSNDDWWGVSLSLSICDSYISKKKEVHQKAGQTETKLDWNSTMLKK